MDYRFDVYGKIVIIERTAHGSWVGYYQGADGKRGRADFPIPDRLTTEELANYLEELFHESATPERPAVIQIAPRTA